MDSWIRNSLLTKAFDGDSVESYRHRAFLGIPTSNLLAILKIGNLFNAPLQFSKFFTKGFSEVFAGVGDHLLKEAATLDAVRKKLGGDWSAQPSSMPIAVVQPWRHGPIVFLAGQLTGV